MCNNALNLSNGKLIVDNNWLVGTYCHWLISAEDENSYITLDFQNINVSYEIYFIVLRNIEHSENFNGEINNVIIL